MDGYLIGGLISVGVVALIYWSAFGGYCLRVWAERRAREKARKMENCRREQALWENIVHNFTCFEEAMRRRRDDKLRRMCPLDALREAFAGIADKVNEKIDEETKAALMEEKIRAMREAVGWKPEAVKDADVFPYEKAALRVLRDAISLDDPDVSDGQPGKKPFRVKLNFAAGYQHEIEAEGVELHPELCGQRPVIISGAVAIPARGPETGGNDEPTTAA